jgi:hypothetical protein
VELEAAGGGTGARVVAGAFPVAIAPTGAPAAMLVGTGAVVMP